MRLLRGGLLPGLRALAAGQGRRCGGTLGVPAGGARAEPGSRGCPGSGERGPGPERGSESTGVPEEGSRPRAERPLGRAAGLCGRPRPPPRAVGSPRRELFCGPRAPALGESRSPASAAMPCSEDAAAVSVSKRARAEDGARLRFVRLSEHATAPTRGSARAAGYDLYSAYDYTIPPMEKAIVKTDIQIAVPSGCYGRVAPRSGLAVKHFIDVGAGVIDEDYRGNVGVVLFNFGKEKFEVKKGDRVAQLICERIFYPDLEEVQALDDTERGTGGFGSTGRN